eukprot:CAMPEP_0117648128 /NCGR_PEP_ID=MMETSP0804-20121206/225_1 /TAXON_ID=1074897 /ORGANISM="Tetraselmis astigmatica, Strain CCMP880" /LENGTH=142 /DNA_ID=CAMNT_0005453681 /DNA_START=309 /DNA_END=734 /DNA_ORIENTATION=+
MRGCIPFIGKGRRMQQVSSLHHDELVSEEDRAMLMDFFRVLNTEWQLKESDEKTGLRVYFMYSEDNPIVTVKGEIEVPADVGTVLDFLHSHGSEFLANMKVMDGMCKSAVVVEEHDEKHKVNYGQFSVPKPASDRDMLWSNF